MGPACGLARPHAQSPGPQCRREQVWCPPCQPVTVLIWTVVEVHTVESTPLVPRSTPGQGWCWTRCPPGHIEPPAVAKAAHQGASALEGRWGRQQVSRQARSEAWAWAPDNPRRGDQAHHSSDSGWYPAVVVAVPGEWRVAPSGRAPHPRCLRPPPPARGLPL